MDISIDIDDPAWNAVVDLEDDTSRAVTAALAAAGETRDVQVSLWFTDDEEVRRLNAEWRGKNTPTNVLSFEPAKNVRFPPDEPYPLGEIVLAAGVVAREAAEQGKPLRDHTLHLVVHGALHLMGLDHVNEADAERMEEMERQILASLGIADPYREAR